MRYFVVHFWSKIIWSKIHTFHYLNIPPGKLEHRILSLSLGHITCEWEASSSQPTIILDVIAVYPACSGSRLHFLGHSRLNFLIQIICAMARDKENSFKLLSIEMENYHINMTMGMYWNEPPWVSLYLTYAYQKKYRYLYR